MTNQRILLAGAGDLCCRAAELLLAQGHQVWGLRRHPPIHDISGVQWLAADLTKPETLTQLPHSISQVIYAPTPDRRTEADYRTLFLDGLRNFLSALDVRALTRFMFVSSSAVYGACDEWVNEDTATNPSEFNGQILVQAEEWLRHELPQTVLFRLTGLYGPQRTELLTRLQDGRARVSRQDKRWANRFHIDDAARAAVHLLGLGQAESCYIGTDDHPHPIHELYDALAAMLNAPVAADAAGAPVAGTRVTGTTTGGKRLSNARLRASGFEPAWPDAIEGYKAIIRQMKRGG
ncbi:MAG: NAD-dependent epimerase/dehydratase family protein [Burkholderiaceae bacterium]